MSTALLPLSLSGTSIWRRKTSRKDGHSTPPLFFNVLHCRQRLLLSQNNSRRIIHLFMDYPRAREQVQAKFKELETVFKLWLVRLTLGVDAADRLARIEMMKEPQNPIAHVQAKFKELETIFKLWLVRLTLGVDAADRLARIDVMKEPQNPIAHVQAKFKELKTIFKLWLVRLTLGVEAADRLARIEMMKEPQNPLANVQAMFKELETGLKAAIAAQGAAIYLNIQALAGVPLVRPRNIAIMMGVNACISCVMKRLRGKEDLLSRMAAAFGSGVMFSLVSGMDGPKQAKNAVIQGLFFALIQRGIYKFFEPPGDDLNYARTRKMLNELGLQNYEKHFRKGLLTDSTLPLLTYSVLRDVGIPHEPGLLILDHIKRDPELKKRSCD